jgi:two-component system, chemotaxis family, protein-glutamate methylesterase/glutaminase
MRKIRVLIVDDAIVVRKVLSTALAADDALEVVGQAENGLIALERIKTLTPDLVVLDVEMPVMDGLTAVTEIRKIWRRLPVIMYSTLTERGAIATLEALGRGATDYATKPDGVGSPQGAVAQIKDVLIPKIKALCKREIERSERENPTTTSAVPVRPVSTPVARAVPAPRPSSGLRRVEIIVIASSTGGPQALDALIPLLPANLPVPMVLVQHMPAKFTKVMAEQLAARAKIRVREIAGGETLEAGTLYVAPGDRHVVLARTARGCKLQTNQDPPEEACRPSANVLFRSAAQEFQGAVLSVVMTGMGQDGLAGVRELRPLGARVIVQDEASSVVWGMPGAVARAGLADEILPLADMAEAIVREVSFGRAVRTVLPVA